jgi:hypothetical protein
MFELSIKIIIVFFREVLHFVHLVPGKGSLARYQEVPVLETVLGVLMNAFPGTRSMVYF